MDCAINALYSFQVKRIGIAINYEGYYNEGRRLRRGGIDYIFRCVGHAPVHWKTPMAKELANSGATTLFVEGPLYIGVRNTMSFS